ncbi:hypothetical protein BDR22DRAFT_889311 [Usnea florida]
MSSVSTDSEDGGVPLPRDAAEAASQDGWRWDEDSTEVENDVSTSSEDGGERDARNITIEITVTLRTGLEGEVVITIEVEIHIS